MKRSQCWPLMHIGSLKHIDVAYLWMQDEIRSKRLRVRRVKSEEHVIAKHGLTLGVRQHG